MKRYMPSFKLLAAGINIQAYNHSWWLQGPDKLLRRLACCKALRILLLRQGAGRETASGVDLLTQLLTPSHQPSAGQVRDHKPGPHWSQQRIESCVLAKACTSTEETSRIGREIVVPYLQGGLILYMRKLGIMGYFRIRPCHHLPIFWLQHHQCLQRHERHYR